MALLIEKIRLLRKVGLMRVAWLFSLLFFSLNIFSEEIIIQNGKNGYSGCTDTFFPNPYSNDFEPKGLLPYLMIEGGN